MKRLKKDLSAGIWALPSFPVVLVTARENAMTAGAFHFYSFVPPSLIVGIMPDKYTHGLITEHGDFGINIPTADQIRAVRICGSLSGRDVPDKLARAGLSPFDGAVIESYLIKECPLNIECKVVHTLEYESSHQRFVGRSKRCA
jgi:flavin reductase (DIM6/NTAB) family NADH-FMN oxidoreductase RutF